METKNSQVEELQVVSFSLKNEEYGLDILRVQEINHLMTITKVPNSPPFVEGIINLRGRIIPIINLREKLSQEPKEFDKHTRIVVVNSNEKIFGLIVDSVSEVLRIPIDRVEPPPLMASGIGPEYIKGVGKLKSNLIILLDVDKLTLNHDS